MVMCVCMCVGGGWECSLGRVSDNIHDQGRVVVWVGNSVGVGGVGVGGAIMCGGEVMCGRISMSVLFVMGVVVVGSGRMGDSWGVVGCV